ncbi:lipoxygenase family protein, partial [Hydrocoleum sp. CS-953]|uniref:lipoxygenase family protein n=1 Tax=Hydrocoleum sp. CS-953 TaxID=1671698 RepID=UPI00352B7AD4
MLFTPLDADEPWMSAKNIVQMADSNYHELISHLGRTHLVVEPFIVPTYNLPENHPLRNLLTPHFEGTVLINYGAHSLLVAPGEAVDSLLASNIGADQSLAAKGSQSYLFNFNAINFPQTLVDRGVNNSDTLPIYPYRDDGQLIWDAIYNWVNDYLSIYYTSDDVIV